MSTDHLAQTFSRRYYICAVLLSLCVLLETLAFTYIQEDGRTYYYSSSLLYCLSGLLVCCIPLVPLRGDRLLPGSSRMPALAIPVMINLLLLSMVIYHIWLLAPIYISQPVDKYVADMLPAIRVACTRLLAGEKVYSQVATVWPHTVEQYFPLMWMPFLPAEILSFDYRWITVAMQFLGLGMAVTALLYRRAMMPALPSVIAGLALFLFLNFFMVKDPAYWSMTEEGVVTGFYLILGFALLSGNYWFIGIAITGCCLSRYSLLFWVPVYFAYVWFTQQRVDFWHLFAAFATTMCVFFVLPFFIWDPVYFFKIPATYTRFIDSFWREYKLDLHLHTNVGFYKFFTARTARSMSIWGAASSLIAPALLIGIAQKLKGRFDLNRRYIPYASLKISLIFFYGFIPMPYHYVFVPVSLLSYMVVLDYLSQRLRDVPVAKPAYSAQEAVL